MTVTILAGGNSERMGQDKALLPAAGSSSLLEHVVKAAASAGSAAWPDRNGAGAEAACRW